MHGLLVVLFVSLYALTKRKWWLTLIFFQVPAFILNIPRRFTWIPQIFYENPGHLFFACLYVFMFGISLTMIVYRPGKNQQEDKWIVQWYYKRAMARIRQHNYGKAIQLFNRAIAINPTISEFFLQRGCAFSEIQFYDEAFKDFEKAKELNPKDERIYYCLAHSFHNMGMNSRALTFINEAISLAPDEVNYYERAKIFEYLWNEEKAISDYTRAIELDEGYTLAYESRGDIFYRKQKFSKALEDYNKLVSIEPKNGTHYYECGTAYQAIGDYSQALVNYNKAIELIDNEPIFFYKRALTYLHLQDYEQALKDLNRSLELEKYYVSLYNTRGCLYLHIQNYEQAVEDINQAIRVDRSRVQRLGEQREIEIGVNTGGDTNDAIDIESEEGIEMLIYVNLKIAIKLGEEVDDFLRFSLFQPYLDKSPFKELVAEYKENKEQQSGNG